MSASPRKRLNCRVAAKCRDVPISDTLRCKNSRRSGADSCTVANVPGCLSQTRRAPNKPAAPVAPRVSQDKRRRGIGRPSAPTVLIMDGPGRLVRARRDRDRAGSGEKRAPDTEAQIVVPIVGGVPVAVGRAEVLWIVVPGTTADDTATRGRPGFRDIGWIKPAVPEDRMAQAPRIRMLRVSNPG